MENIDKQRKLKEQYHLSTRPRYLVGREFFFYYKRRDYYHRSFSTKQERSLYQLHLAEYRNSKLKLRARRGNALPDDWDDLNSSLHKKNKSWKTSSRRKHQWFRISHI